jgi:hypothetical protein
MGDVIRFPQERVDHFRSTDYSQSATIMILPVVRIERAYVVEDPFAILGGIESARCRAAFAELEAAVEGDNFP